MHLIIEKNICVHTVYYNTPQPDVSDKIQVAASAAREPFHGHDIIDAAECLEN